MSIVRNTYFRVILYTLLLSLIVRIVFFGISIALNIGPRSDHFYLTQSTDLSDESLAGISLYQNIHNDSFIQKYGSGRNDRNNSLFDYYQLEDGIVVATQLQDDKIIRISIGLNSNPSLATAKGIFPGDSIEVVEKKYGKNYYERVEQGIDIRGYVDKQNHRTIEFWHWNGNVQQIRYDIDEME
ncbi:hypothetical protein [Ammoniphilus sp. 3BR4]|uniref:hypothetical protein n=1 Tax=Ammoniphilus sp. 3BR4 TaxID=3158265 RepID=UPI003465BC86